MHQTVCSGLVHWDDPGGWDGEGIRRGALDGEHMCTRSWFMLMYGKNHYNIVKQLASNLNNFKNKNNKTHHSKIIASSSLITSWQIDGEKVEIVTDFTFLGSKTTGDINCSHKIKRCLLLGRKAMTNLESIFKSRDNTLPTKVCVVKAMIFPVVMYGCECWTIKNAKHWRTDAFELRCGRRLLTVPWTTRRSNQSILKEISPE